MWAILSSIVIYLAVGFAESPAKVFTPPPGDEWIPWLAFWAVLLFPFPVILTLAIARIFRK
jgi:hypothetical protein